MLLDVLISDGSLFPSDGPFCDVLFKPLFDFRKGWFDLWKDHHVFNLLGLAEK